VFLVQLAEHRTDMRCIAVNVRDHDDNVAGAQRRIRAEALEQLLRDGKLWLSRGASVAIFPEGTRSKDGAIHRFKTGAFTLAREAGVDILPVVMDGTRTMVQKNRLFNWHNTVTVRVLSPISAEQIAHTEPKVLMDQVREQMSEALAEVRCEVKK
ncbi:MAG: lysophospholipid acyltransferase family protein, partial [Alistipes sp.]